MSKLFSNYARKSFEIVKGEGSYLWDDAGKKYLDFTAGIGVVNVGYHNQVVEEALAKQARLLWHTPNLYLNQLQEEVAAKLIGEKDYLAFFCNSGAEANEAAIKLARKATGKTKIITFLQSFHGRTYGSMSATGQDSIHSGFAPLVPGFEYLPYNELAPLKAALDDDTAGVMLEVIQGEGGVLPANHSWLQEVAKLCQEKGVLLIVDEIQTGMGRTGSLYAFEQFDIEPDIITLAKGLGNGIPVGAMLGKQNLGSAFGPGSHGSTFGGNKLAMAAASAVLDELKADNFFQVIQAKSQLTFDFLAPLTKLSSIVEIRGQGLMIGIVCSEQLPVTQILAELEKQGILALRAGQNVLRLLPPLTISKEELVTGLTTIKAVIEQIAE
ncbi:MAG: acetylornithine transaminase [Enterococcus sp.]